jgi:hypothetical protein
VSFGTVAFTVRDRQHVATLEDDRSWTVVPRLPDDAAPLILPTLVDIAAEDLGPAGGPYGPAQLHAAAERLGGEATIAPKEEPPPGLVY